MNSFFFQFTYFSLLFILFLFTSVILGVVKIGGPWTRSMIGVHGPGPYFDGPGPWIRSMEGVHGPAVHVLYFCAMCKSLQEAIHLFTVAKPMQA